VGTVAPLEAGDRRRGDDRAAPAAGAHGDMTWLAAKAARRADPRALWPDVRSVIMLGVNYGPHDDPLAFLKRRTRGTISVYARGDDYHELIKSRLKNLGRWLIDDAGGDIKVFVDTAPVMEKPLAAAAGIGWQGKHTNLVSRERGSWLFLGAIFSTLDLPPDEPERDRCGSCHACLDVCPTDAFPAPYRLDARRCISYLTIEHRGDIDDTLREDVGEWLFGCDICQDVCPWNAKAAPTREPAFHPARPLEPLTELLALTPEAFRARFRGSAMTRTKRAGLLRNAALVLGNRRDPAAVPALTRALDDPDPAVRNAAAWALEHIVNASATRQRPMQ